MKNLFSLPEIREAIPNFPIRLTFASRDDVTATFPVASSLLFFHKLLPPFVWRMGTRLSFGWVNKLFFL
jgi:hypothetical protein